MAPGQRCRDAETVASVLDTHPALVNERVANPNIRDEGDHACPIHFAAGWAVCFEYANHVDVARYLLEHGARYTLWTAVALGEARRMGMVALAARLDAASGSA